MWNWYIYSKFSTLSDKAKIKIQKYYWYFSERDISKFIMMGEEVFKIFARTTKV